MTPAAASLRRRYLLLRATRWFPTGLLIPVLVLLLLGRGFSVAQIGVAMAAQGVTVLLLELPTGGLADSLGRRPVLLAATTVELAAGATLLVVDTMPVLVLVFVLFGIYRALESGPLDAWYVDAAQAEDPELDLPAVLSVAGSVVALALAGGALVAGLLVAVEPGGFDPLAVPVALALGLRGLDLLLLWRLMDEERERVGGAVRASVNAVPAVIRSTGSLVRGSAVLGSLIALEFFWGFGMTAFEALTPVKLAEATDDPSRAAALFGPATTAAWIAAAAGAMAANRLAARWDAARAAIVLQLAQAATVAAMAVAAGPVGILAWWIGTMALHGGLNPLYQALLHAEADAAHRTTVLSAASMATHPGGAVGGVTLGLVAERASITTAVLVGAAALTICVPLYLPAVRASRD